MKRAIVIAWVCGGLLAARAEVRDVRSHLENVSPDHPRLLLGRGQEEALRERIASDPLLHRAAAYVETTAVGIGELAPVERRMTGRRLLGVSRTCLKRVFYLATARRLGGDGAHAARARDEMLAAAAFSDWNPKHFLDVAEMTAALAFGYDWLYEDLDPEARRIIREAIVEKGLKTSLPGGWWVGTENNWNQVCHGGLVLGALAVLEDEPDLAARIIDRAVTSVPKAMAEYAPDGAYPEGPGYWDYGTTYNVLLIAALASVLGTDFGLSEARGFLGTADYYLQVTGPTGLYFNYSDCGTRGGVAPAMYWFADRRRDPSLLWRERRELERILARPPDAKGSSNRMFPLFLLWAPGSSDPVAPKARHWKADGRTPIGVHRGGWATGEETYVAVKGGSPGSNHAHMDAGTFVMDALGVRWAEDLGSQSYHELESAGIGLWDRRQDGERWDVFRLNSFSHNTLVVDGRKQRVDGHAPIVGFSDSGTMPHTIVDLAAVYEGQLAAARRGVAVYRDRSVLVQDEVKAPDRRTAVRWGMVTRADVRIEDARRATLRRNGRELRLRIRSPAAATLRLFETAKPPREHDAPNPGTRMIGFVAELAPSEAATLTVWLQPVDAGGEGDGPAMQPLSAW